MDAEDASSAGSGAQQAPASGGAVRPRRRGLVTAMIVIATLLAFFAIFAVWANRQALNTDNWATSSSQLLESAPIRTAVSTYLVDQAYKAFDVPAQLQSVLPKRAAPLAGPAASGLQGFAQKGVDELLQRPAVQSLWVAANRRAHARLMQVLNGGTAGVSTQGGTVTLDLGTLLQSAASGIGVGQQAAQKVPPGTAQITILHSNQLGTAQDVVKALRALPIILLVLSLGLFAGAVALAGRRREALRSVGIGLFVAGVAALLARTVAGNAVVDALASTAAAKPATHDVWRIETSQLVIAAQATIAYGVLIVLAAWLAGPTRVAVGARAAAAPYLRDPRYAFGGLALLVLLVIAWGPTPATRNAITLLVLAALLALGMEALRRQTAREHPDATPAVAAERRRAWFTHARERTSATFESAQERLRQEREQRSGSRAASAGAVEAGESARLDALERLARLRDTGVLDEQEFAAEKRRLLGGEPG